MPNLQENRKYAERFVELRKMLGMTANKMASLCQYSGAHIIAIEKGEDAPSMEMIDCICDLFHVNKEWLTLGTGEMFTDEEGLHRREHQIVNVPIRLKSLREREGKNYKQFAQFVGCNTETYRAAELGMRTITLRQAKKIADACNVGIDWLMYGEETAKEYPLNDRMLEYLQKYPEIRKMVLEKIQQINNDEKE